MGFGSGRCAFHPLAHYISPADSNRVRIHTSGRVAPGIIQFIALKLQELIDFSAQWLQSEQMILNLAPLNMVMSLPT
jgi:hypothetical protein